MTDERAEPFDPLDGVPRPVVAEVLRRATRHVDELLAAELHLATGGAVRIVCVPEVEAWLRTLASRVELGARLKPPAG